MIGDVSSDEDFEENVKVQTVERQFAKSDRSTAPDSAQLEEVKIAKVILQEKQ